MRKLLSILSATLSCALLAHAGSPQVGDLAPNFKLKGSDGLGYQLSDFKGKQAVVVAWFPKAFTGG